MSDVMTSAESSRSAMTFPDILAPASIRMDVEATCRREVLSLLAKIVAQQTSAPAEDICTALHERERLGSTALGNGLAVPHANVRGVSGCHAAMVVLREPVRFAADDERPVSVAVALISTEGRCDPRQLSSIARTFRRPDTASELKRLGSAEAVHAHLVALFSALAA